MSTFFFNMTMIIKTHSTLTQYYNKNVFSELRQKKMQTKNNSLVMKKKQHLLILSF